MHRSSKYVKMHIQTIYYWNHNENQVSSDFFFFHSTSLLAGKEKVFLLHNETEKFKLFFKYAFGGAAFVFPSIGCVNSLMYTEYYVKSIKTVYSISLWSRCTHTPKLTHTFFPFHILQFEMIMPTMFVIHTESKPLFKAFSNVDILNGICSWCCILFFGCYTKIQNIFQRFFCVLCFVFVSQMKIFWWWSVNYGGSVQSTNFQRYTLDLLL